MRRLTIYLTILVSSLGLSHATADEAQAGSGGRLIAIEVLIADLVVGDQPAQDEAVDAAVARVRDAEKQGKLSRVTRLRLTTLSEQQAMAQFGERVAVSTGRASFAGGGRGGSGNMAESFTYHNAGTIAQITPRVEGNKVIMECNVEQSRLVPKAGAKPTVGNQTGAPESPAFHPESIETITAKSVVQMKSGQTVLLTSRQQQSGDEGLRTYILVTGTIQGE
jgi:hypothetical protein